MVYEEGEINQNPEKQETIKESPKDTGFVSPREELIKKVKEEKEIEASLDPDKIVELDLNKLSEAAETKTVAPAGYFPVELSTKGFLGAPKLFHIRCFDTKDLMNMALSEQEDLPIKLIELFDKLIYEEDISVEVFHTSEVIELTIVMIRSFMSRFLKDLPYELTEEDYEFEKKRLGGADSEEYKRFLQDLGKVFKPKTTIDIDALEYYNVDENTKLVIKATHQDFSAKFSYPRYGDVAVLKRFLDKEFKEKDKKYSSLMSIIKKGQEAEQRVLEGDEKINFRHIPKVTDQEMKEIQVYNTEKSIFMVYALKALHLVELNGIDVSKMSLGERIKLVKDEPRFTHEIFSQVTEFFDTKLKVGINIEKVPHLNPIQNKSVVAPFPFRLDHLLQIARDSKSDFTTIEFE